MDINDDDNDTLTKLTNWDKTGNTDERVAWKAVNEKKDNWASSELSRLQVASARKSAKSKDYGEKVVGIEEIFNSLTTVATIHKAETLLVKINTALAADKSDVDLLKDLQENWRDKDDSTDEKTAWTAVNGSGDNQADRAIKNLEDLAGKSKKLTDKGKEIGDNATSEQEVKDGFQALKDQAGAEKPKIENYEKQQIAKVKIKTNDSASQSEKDLIPLLDQVVEDISESDLKTLQGKLKGYKEASSNTELSQVYSKHTEVIDNMLTRATERLEKIEEQRRRDDDGNDSPQQQPNNSDKGLGTGWIIAIVVSVIAVLGAAVYYWWSQNRDKEE